MLSGIVTGGGFNSSGVSSYSGGAALGAAATSMAVLSSRMTKAAGAPVQSHPAVGRRFKGGNSAMRCC